MQPHGSLCCHTTQLPSTSLRATSTGELAKRSRDGFHLQGLAPEGLPQIPVGIWLCSPARQCPWAARGSRPPSSCSSWSLEENAGYNMNRAQNRRGDVNTYTSKLMRQMRITMKWLFLHPYFSAKKDADQRQEQVPKAVKPMLQLKGS